ncbi:Citrate lyase alpha chain [Sporanaerobacter sp. PP17-6a]|nr:Citrate lyase alpha chain [Sporanaerobacter sp. PP17-6a]
MKRLDYMINEVGRKIPTYIEGIGEIKPYGVKKHSSGGIVNINNENKRENKSKLLPSLRDAIIKSGLKDGMTISFHHHLRNGDYVLNMVMKEISSMGIKNLTILASSLTQAHESLVEYIKDGTITGLQTSGLRGCLAREISKNCILKTPVIFRTHGGRVRAIKSGDIKIDVAFIAASCCDEMGNMNGQCGKSSFGSMGYAMIDSLYADKVIAITDNLVDYPAYPISINQTLVDYVVEVDSIGNTELIGTGTTRVTSNPRELLIADYASKVLIESGLVKQNFSFQAGSGGSSLAVAKYLREYMLKNNIVGSFALGGITSYMVEMLENGLFRSLLDVQTFDKVAVDSYGRNKNHIEMSADMYANPDNKGCVVDKLDIAVLSATEVDVNYNVNVITASTGDVIGAVGGHPDVAAGAKLTVIVTPLMRKRFPIIVDKVTTVVTPGTCVDAVITDRGIAVNPKNQKLLELLSNKGLPLVTIEELRDKAQRITGKPETIKFGDKVIGVVEYRDGSIMDVIYNVE